MDDERTFIILRGIPSSGKSTLARLIMSEFWLRKLEFAYLSTDDLFTVGNKYLFNRDKLHLFHRANYERFELAINNGIPNVILDNTNTTFKEFSDYVEYAILYGYEVEIREPETPWRYDVEECTKRNKHGVPREVIQRMLDRWESTEYCLQKIEEMLELYA